MDSTDAPRPATYHRPQAHTHGQHHTCPFCLRQQKTTKKGYMVRHGWQEEGRRVGIAWGVRRAHFGKAAKREMRRWGLAGWAWDWLRPADHPDLPPDLAKGIVGLCDFAARTIYVDPAHVDADPWPEVLDTLRHEIAHAASGLSGHGPTWQAWARACGARPNG